MLKKTARFISLLFHPVLLPTLGFLLMFNSGFYFTYLPWEARRFVLLVVFFTTAVLPVLAVALMVLKPTFDLSLEKTGDRLLVFLFTAAFYYLGFVLLKRADYYPVFKILFLASVLLIIAVLLVSLQWRISSHMAAAGGLTGAVFALAFRTGINPVPAIAVIILISGLAGTARLILGKSSLAQVAAGYVLGFTVLYVITYLI